MSELGQSSVGIVNQTILNGVVIQPAEFRFTPTGRQVAMLIVEHLSESEKSAPIQHLELRMPVVALGDLAQTCRDIAVGQNIRVEGSLNQKRWIRDGKVRWGKTELIARTIHLLDDKPAVINN
ncbi:MAG: single-stranded DNA-binding protein [Magnetococcales bacterium]|nr:single-stranded DNA-binding protein [Magnetococcales bacterium]